MNASCCTHGWYPKLGGYLCLDLLRKEPGKSGFQFYVVCRIYKSHIRTNQLIDGINLLSILLSINCIFCHEWNLSAIHGINQLVNRTRPRMNGSIVIGYL